MSTPAADYPRADRRSADEKIAAEPHLVPPQLPPDAISAPVETHLARQRRQSLAIAGIVENGLIRPLDAAVKLTEHSRIIIMAEAN